LYFRPQRLPKTAILVILYYDFGHTLYGKFLATLFFAASPTPTTFASEVESKLGKMKIIRKIGRQKSAQVNCMLPKLLSQSKRSTQQQRLNHL